MNWTSLLESKYAADAFIKGHFFVIKFTPDIVAQEVHNLGIGFIQEGESKIRFRLLDSSLRGFNCIYGKEPTEGLRLLLDSLSLALDTVGYTSPPSAQVKYTTLMPISGLSVKSIIDSLYRDYIHMDHYQQEKKPKPSILNTSELRKGLKSNLQSINRSSYFQENKVFLESDINDGKIVLDLPIWRPQANETMFGHDYLFASVVSADYIDKDALSFNLDYLGCTSVQNACLLTSREAKAGLFIYRPSFNERITKEAMDIIDSHIDNSLYNLKRLKKKEGYDIEIEVLDAEEEVYDKVATFVN